MHFKRRKRKDARAGCLMCKPHKACGSKHSSARLPLAEKRARKSEREQRQEAA